MNTNATGDWVITDGERFFNPHTGGMDKIFFPTKHLFHKWKTVEEKFHCYGDKSFDGKQLYVESVALNPVFTRIESPPVSPIFSLTYHPTE
jgi:hypothetical protein